MQQNSPFLSVQFDESDRGMQCNLYYTQVIEHSVSPKRSPHVPFQSGTPSPHL